MQSLLLQQQRRRLHLEVGLQTGQASGQGWQPWVAALAVHRQWHKRGTHTATRWKEEEEEVYSEGSQGVCVSWRVVHVQRRMDQTCWQPCLAPTHSLPQIHVARLGPFRSPWACFGSKHGVGQVAAMGCSVSPAKQRGASSPLVSNACRAGRVQGGNVAQQSEGVLKDFGFAGM